MKRLLIEFITEPKKTPSVGSWDELDSDMSSSFRGNHIRKNVEDVIKTIPIFGIAVLLTFGLMAVASL